MSRIGKFYEGVGSVYDLHGRNHFNDFETYPGPRTALKQHWENIECYFKSSVNKFASDRNLQDSHVSDTKKGTESDNENKSHSIKTY